ncbi:hypothetical protein B0H67DRAFT_340617 [Lasiosphaeris hirsuta]|uniref:Apple domain-containing protein n=1 Tax=Lasiosphaeris hirsuta TaxID=260670 RepID=A0AA40DMB3_9PEZI|nr:hypothetical protein B0H67DRAFT_340617 [Lasiosphaeris hirsuta]
MKREMGKMGRIAILATAALGLLPTALSIRGPIGPPLDPPPIGFPIPVRPGSCAGKALGYLTCHDKHQSPACIQQVAVQAVAFCSSYLSQTATVFNTVTEVTTATSTATETYTSEATATDTSTSISGTTATETQTETSTSTSTFTVSTSYIPPTDTLFARFEPSAAASTSCLDLSTRALTRRPAAKISSVCSCLGVTTAATTTITTETLTTGTTTTEATTTDTTTTETTTTTEVQVSVSTTTATTTTTTTSGTVATETAILDYCDITYNGGGVTEGNTVISAGDLSGRDCCVLCWYTENCVASAVGVGFCQLLVKKTALDGAPTSAVCPLGVEDYTYLEGPGTLYRGPCSPGLN